MDVTPKNSGLSAEVINKILNCFANYSEVKKVILYGSRAKGNFHKGSDIDLCLVGEEANTSTVLKIENDLDDLLLPYTFDISVYHQLDNEKFIDHIDRVGKIIYER